MIGSTNYLFHLFFCDRARFKIECTCWCKTNTKHEIDENVTIGCHK